MANCAGAVGGGGAAAAGSWLSSAAPLHRSADQVKSEKQDLSRPDASLSVLITHERAHERTNGRADERTGERKRFGYNENFSIICKPGQ